MSRNKDADPKLTKRQQLNLRHKIALRADKVIDRLDKIARGEIKGASTAEVAAGKALLNKVLPEQSANELTIQQEQRVYNREEIYKQLLGVIDKLPEDWLVAFLQKILKKLPRERAQKIYGETMGYTSNVTSLQVG